MNASPTIPAAEPPVGTVAEFFGRFASGGGYSSGLLLRHAGGWGTGSVAHPWRRLRTWAELADLSVMNAAVLVQNPESTTVIASVYIAIVAGPPVGAEATDLRADALTGAASFLRTVGNSDRGVERAAGMLHDGAMDVIDGSRTPLVRAIEAATADRLAFEADFFAAAQSEEL